MADLALVAELGSKVLKHRGAIRAIRVTPDGKRIVSLGDSAAIHLWDTATGESRGDLAGSDRGLYSLAISADGKRVFAGGNEAQVFELATKRKLATLRVRKPLIVAAAFGPDHSIYFGDDRIVRHFDPEGDELAPLKGHQSRVEAIAISREGRRALTCGGDRKIKLQALDTATPEVLATWDGYAKSCGFSPDGTLAWSVGFDHAIVRGMTTGKTLFEADLDQIRVGAMAIDGASFAVATEEAVLVYALPSKRQIARIAFSADTLAFTPDGTRLVVANDGRGRATGSGVSVFDIAGERRVLPADAGHTGAVAGLAIAREVPHLIFSIGADGLVVMWDLDTGTPIERLGTVAGEGRAIAVTADGTQLVTCSTQGGLARWTVQRTESVAIPVDGYSGLAVAISPAGTQVAYLSYSPRNVQVYELGTGAAITKTKSSRSHRHGAIAFAGETAVASNSADGTAMAIELPSGRRLWAAPAAQPISTLCIAGGALIVGTTGGALEAWDPLTGMRRTVLRRSGPEVQRLCALDADHVGIIQRSADFDSSTLEVWQVAKPRCVGSVELAAFNAEARSITGSPDGRRLYVGTNTSRILVFERG